MIDNKYLGKISEPEAQFILDHSEKQLKDILDTNLDIVGRTTNIVGIAMAIMIALIGYAINRWETNHKWDELLITATASTLYLFIAVKIVAKNLHPKEYYTIGAEPQDFFIDRVFKDSNKEYRLTAILFNEIQAVQKRIEHNKSENEKKWSNLRSAISMLYFLPVFVGGIYLISAYLPLC